MGTFSFWLLPEEEEEEEDEAKEGGKEPPKTWSWSSVMMTIIFGGEEEEEEEVFSALLEVEAEEGKFAVKSNAVVATALIQLFIFCRLSSRLLT